MTIPDDLSGHGVPDLSGARIKRTLPPRTGAYRMGSVGSGASAGGSGGKPKKDPNQRLRDATADSVKVGYAAIAANVLQGRMAAERFRRGDYNIRDIPDDLSKVSDRMQGLLKEFSTTGVELVGSLIRAAEPWLPSSPLKLTVHYKGRRGMAPTTHALTRPTVATAHNDVTATPLHSRTGAAAITNVKFEGDVSSEGGLVATVTVPSGQPAGFYSGLVFAPRQDVPLGVLTIQIP